MATVRPLIRYADTGRIEELRASDSLPGGGGGGGGATVTQREVDFGSPGAAEKFFTVTITGATVGQRVIATASLDMPSGVDEDELEMDPIVCAARVSASDTVRLLVAAPGGGRISGKRNINITIGA